MGSALLGYHSRAVRSRFPFQLIAGLLLCGACSRNGAPPATPVTFTKDVAPIVFANCRLVLTYACPTRLSKYSESPFASFTTSPVSKCTRTAPLST
jgi:hypothetical protein